MNRITHTTIVNFIWIADDVFCDVHVRGKYREVLLDGAGDDTDMEG